MHLLKPIARFSMVAGFAAALAACGSDSGQFNEDGTPQTKPPVANSVVCADVLLSDATGAKSVLLAEPFATTVPQLIKAILDPSKQSQADLLAPIKVLKEKGTSQQCELALFVSHLTAADDLGKLSPLVLTLNTVLVGLNQGLTPEQVASGLESILALSEPSNPGTQGLISAVTNLTGGLLGGTILSPVNDLLNFLLNPKLGVLAPLTGVVDQLTDKESGALGALTSLVDQLVNTKDEALNPLIALLNGILGGSENGQTPEEIAQGLLALANGQLFTKVIVAMVPFFGEELAKVAPVAAPQMAPAGSQAPTGSIPAGSGTSTDSTGGTSTAAAPSIPVIGDVIGQIPVLGPLLNQILGGLLSGLFGGFTKA